MGGVEIVPWNGGEMESERLGELMRNGQALVK